MGYYTNKEDFTMKFELKSYSPTRFSNMRACDAQYYKFSADWAVPQPRETIDAALKEFDWKLKAIASADVPDDRHLTSGPLRDLAKPLKSALVC